MSSLAKFINPMFYQQSFAAAKTRAHAYYHPLMRNNSATPLWHAMIAVSFIMYSGTYYARTYPEQQERRAIKRQAMAEYYEKHGGGDHH